MTAIHRNRSLVAVGGSVLTGPPMQIPGFATKRQ